MGERQYLNGWMVCRPKPPSGRKGELRNWRRNRTPALGEGALREAGEGCATEPAPASENILKSTPLSPRFGSEEGRCGDKLKIRVIGDSKASRVNELLSMEATSIPRSLEVFVGAASMFSWPGCARRLATFALDFPYGYMRVGIPFLQLGFSTAILSNPDGLRRYRR